MSSRRRNRIRNNNEMHYSRRIEYEPEDYDADNDSPQQRLFRERNTNIPRQRRPICYREPINDEPENRNSGMAQQYNDNERANAPVFLSTESNRKLRRNRAKPSFEVYQEHGTMDVQHIENEQVVPEGPIKTPVDEPSNEFYEAEQYVNNPETNQFNQVKPKNASGLITTSQTESSHDGRPNQGLPEKVTVQLHCGTIKEIARRLRNYEDDRIRVNIIVRSTDIYPLENAQHESSTSHRASRLRIPSVSCRVDKLRRRYRSQPRSSRFGPDQISNNRRSNSAGPPKRRHHG